MTGHSVASVKIRRLNPLDFFMGYCPYDCYDGLLNGKPVGWAMEERQG